MWYHNEDSCLYDNENEFVYANYESFLFTRKVEVMNEFSWIWTNYKQIAWGKDTFRPSNAEGKDTMGGIAFFMADNLDSTYLLGS
jgi:hypothetical protein